MKTKYRSVFISDVHLGSRGCKAEELAKFLDSIECDYLFLVGDILDLWRLKSSWYWPGKHNTIIRKLLKIAKKTRVYYIPGNHDETFREFGDINFGDIEIREEHSHELIQGKALIVHGDQFDHVICHNKWLAILGAKVYEILLTINTLYNRVRKAFGKEYWSLSGYLKLKAKKAVKVIDNFERAVTQHARSEGYQFVICGHIHRAEIKKQNGVTYINCGDWVESCTAIVEYHDGRLEIVR